MDFKAEIEKVRMTKKALLQNCKDNKLYMTPRLNDVLYLHYKGFPYIENLEEYTGLRCLWLECNAISEIQGLDNQPDLRSLYLHHNLITTIENLDKCPLLDTLNLAHNQLLHISNCGSDILPNLHTLDLSNNRLKSLEGLENLKNCLTVSVLSLANNRIEDPLILNILGAMPELRVLTLMGNPVIRNIPAYRKTLILGCVQLRYLDDRPVFPRDRACAEAWKRGGYEEERNEHNRWIQKERDKINCSVRALIKMKNKARGEPTSPSTSEKESEDSSADDLEDATKTEKKKKKKKRITETGDGESNSDAVNTLNTLEDELTPGTPAEENEKVSYEVNELQQRRKELNILAKAEYINDLQIDYIPETEILRTRKTSTDETMDNGDKMTNQFKFDSWEEVSNIGKDKDIHTENSNATQPENNVALHMKNAELIMQEDEHDKEQLKSNIEEDSRLCDGSESLNTSKDVEIICETNVIEVCEPLPEKGAEGNKLSDDMTNEETPLLGMQQLNEEYVEESQHNYVDTETTEIPVSERDICHEEVGIEYEQLMIHEDVESVAEHGKTIENNEDKNGTVENLCIEDEDNIHLLAAQTEIKECMEDIIGMASVVVNNDATISIQDNKRLEGVGNIPEDVITLLETEVTTEEQDKGAYSCDELKNEVSTSNLDNYNNIAPLEAQVTTEVQDQKACFCDELKNEVLTSNLDNYDNIPPLETSNDEDEIPTDETNNKEKYCYNDGNEENEITLVSDMEIQINMETTENVTLEYSGNNQYHLTNDDQVILHTMFEGSANLLPRESDNGNILENISKEDVREVKEQQDGATNKTRSEIDQQRNDLLKNINELDEMIDMLSTRRSEMLKNKEINLQNYISIFGGHSQVVEPITTIQQEEEDYETIGDYEDEQKAKADEIRKKKEEEEFASMTKEQRRQLALLRRHQREPEYITRAEIKAKIEDIREMSQEWNPIRKDSNAVSSEELDAIERQFVESISGKRVDEEDGASSEIMADSSTSSNLPSIIQVKPVQRNIVNIFTVKKKSNDEEEPSCCSFGTQTEKKEVTTQSKATQNFGAEEEQELLKIEKQLNDIMRKDEPVKQTTLTIENEKSKKYLFKEFASAEFQRILHKEPCLVKNVEAIRRAKELEQLALQKEEDSKQSCTVMEWEPTQEDLKEVPQKKQRSINVASNPQCLGISGVNSWSNVMGPSKTVDNHGDSLKDECVGKQSKTMLDIVLEEDTKLFKECSDDETEERKPARLFSNFSLIDKVVTPPEATLLDIVRVDQDESKEDGSKLDDMDMFMKGFGDIKESEIEKLTERWFPREGKKSLIEEMVTENNIKRKKARQYQITRLAEEGRSFNESTILGSDVTQNSFSELDIFGKNILYVKPLKENDEPLYLHQENEEEDDNEESREQDETIETYHNSILTVNKNVEKMNAKNIAIGVIDDVISNVLESGISGEEHPILGESAESFTTTATSQDKLTNKEIKEQSDSKVNEVSSDENNHTQNLPTVGAIEAEQVDSSSTDDSEEWKIMEDRGGVNTEKIYGIYNRNRMTEQPVEDESEDSARDLHNEANNQASSSVSDAQVTRQRNVKSTNESVSNYLFGDSNISSGFEADCEETASSEETDDDEDDFNETKILNDYISCNDYKCETSLNKNKPQKEEETVFPAPVDIKTNDNCESDSTLMDEVATVVQALPQNDDNNVKENV